MAKNGDLCLADQASHFELSQNKLSLQAQNKLSANTLLILEVQELMCKQGFSYLQHNSIYYKQIALLNIYNRFQTIQVVKNNYYFKISVKFIIKNRRIAQTKQS